MMKKIILFLLMVSCGSTAFAATGPTVFGILEQNATFGDETELWSDETRIGVKGSEPVGDNTLQYKFAIGTHDNSTISIKDAWIALGTDVGTLKMGKYFNFLTVAGLETIDVFETKTIRTSNGLRRDGAVSYVSPSFDGFQVGVNVVPPADKTENSADLTEFGASYKYGRFYTTLIYHDDNANDEQVTFLGAKYKYSFFDLFGGYEHINNPTGEDENVYSGGTSFMYRKFKLAFAAQHSDVQGNIYTTEASKKLSKATKLSFNYQSKYSDNLFTVGLRYDF